MLISKTKAKKNQNGIHIGTLWVPFAHWAQIVNCEHRSPRNKYNFLRFLKIFLKKEICQYSKKRVLTRNSYFKKIDFNSLRLGLRHVFQTKMTLLLKNAVQVFLLVLLKQGSFYSLEIQFCVLKRMTTSHVESGSLAACKFHKYWDLIKTKKDFFSWIWAFKLQRFFQNALFYWTVKWLIAAF